MVETVGEWASRVNPSSKDCYFKFYVGGNSDFMESIKGKPVIKAIPAPAIEWLVNTLPDLVDDPDIMRRDSADLKWLDAGTLAKDAVPVISHADFVSELDAWYDDFLGHVEERRPETDGFSIALAQVYGKLFCGMSISPS